METSPDDIQSGDIQSGDSHQNAFKHIIEDQFQEKLYTGFINNTVLFVLMEVIAYAHDIVQALECSDKSPAVACGAGCSYCCHSQIRVLPIEALLILSFIDDYFSKDQTVLLKGKIEQRLELTRGKTIDSLFALRDKLPCIFLENGMCSIYQARPFICRAWNSMDASVCKTIFNLGRFDDEIESSSARTFVFESSRSFFTDLGRQLKLETIPFEMTQAISNCLETKQPLLLWLSGQNILDITDQIAVDPHAFKSQQDKTIQTLSVSREREYIDYFYDKYTGCLAGKEFLKNDSQVHSFIFQNVYGKPIGVIALNEADPRNKTVHIHHIRAFVPRSGSGTQMLLELCRKADCFNIRLSANPAFKSNDEFSQTDFKALSLWYEQFGFKGEAGLYRNPRQG